MNDLKSKKTELNKRVACLKKKLKDNLESKKIIKQARKEKWDNGKLESYLLGIRIRLFVKSIAKNPKVIRYVKGIKKY